MHEFDRNYDLLKIYLKSYGWIKEKEDNAFTYFQNTSDQRIRLPIGKEDEGFPAAFEVALNNIKGLCPELYQLPIISILRTQLINMRQKYLKEKKNWILLEANSKYQPAEIPEMYIPKKPIFTVE